jgi:hypothetical protein
MTCDNCGVETDKYRVVEHKFERDRLGNLTGVVNIVHCAECIQKEQNDRANNDNLSKS